MKSIIHVHNWPISVKGKTSMGGSNAEGSPKAEAYAQTDGVDDEPLKEDFGDTEFANVLSPPRPIRKTADGVHDEIYPDKRVWKRVAQNSPTTPYLQDEDSRPGLSPLTIFSDYEMTGSSTPSRFYHTPRAIKARSSSIEYSPFLIPSQRSMQTNAYYVVEFDEPLLRTSERARSRNYESYSLPSTPHRILQRPSRSPASTSTSTTDAFSASLSPILSPPRMKSRVYRGISSRRATQLSNNR